MKKTPKFMLIGAALLLTAGFAPADSNMMGNAPPPMGNPPPPIDSAPPMEALPPTVTAPPPLVPSSSTSSPASTELVPLSDLSESAKEKPAKTAKTKKTSHKSKHKKKSSHRSAGGYGGQSRIRTAQISLTQLGYRPGSADGIMGPKTKSAIKSFQRDHHLKPDGILGPMTFDALMRETGSKNPMRSSSARPENFFATHPDYYGYYGADYANPTSFGSPQMIPNRFGNMELDAQQTGQTYQYALVLNGQPIFHADNQPAPINVSRTFTIGNADAIVLTAYAPGDRVCPYRHYVLGLRQNSNGLHAIENCTRDYEAFTEQGTLFISFPGDSHNGWNAGAMWRYENGSLEKL